MKKLIYLLALITIFSSCRPDQNEWIVATIKQGEHTSNLDSPNIPASQNTCIQMLFDESNRTDTTMNHINKVYGVSDGWNHKIHSVRIGYRYMADRGDIAIYAFSHINRNMTTNSSNILGYVSINEVSDCACYSITNDEYIYTYGKNTVIHDREKSGTILMYTLKPYFGGNPTAPHDMTVRYREVKL